MTTSIELSQSERNALVLLRQHGGVSVNKIPDVAEGAKPGIKVFSSLIRKQLVYRADGWTPKGGHYQAASYELTYEGALMAKEIAQDTKRTQKVEKIELSELRPIERIQDPFEPEAVYE